MKRLIGLALLVGVLALSGCQRGIEPKVEAQARPVVAVDQKADKEAHYCVGITKAGVRCRKRVKAEGDYCWMHANQDKRVK